MGWLMISMISVYFVFIGFWFVFFYVDGISLFTCSFLFSIYCPNNKKGSISNNIEVYPDSKSQFQSNCQPKLKNIITQSSLFVGYFKNNYKYKNTLSLIHSYQQYRLQELYIQSLLYYAIFANTLDMIAIFATFLIYNGNVYVFTWRNLNNFSPIHSRP